MPRQREIRCFDYVNHRYDQVRDTLMANAAPAFGRATKRASAHADEMSSQLHVHIGAVDVATEIEISVHGVEETPGHGKVPPVTRVDFEWHARESPHLFPLMHAELRAYPLTARDTQLEFAGHYEPPLGVLGTAVDAVVGNRIADASIQRFVAEVAEFFRATLA